MVSNLSWCQSRKSELSIDGLIMAGSCQSFAVGQRQNKFCKISEKCSLSALLNFPSLIVKKHFLKILFRAKRGRRPSGVSGIGLGKAKMDEKKTHHHDFFLHPPISPEENLKNSHFSRFF